MQKQEILMKSQDKSYIHREEGTNMKTCSNCGESTELGRIEVSKNLLSVELMKHCKEQVSQGWCDECKLSDLCEAVRNSHKNSL